MLNIKKQLAEKIFQAQKAVFNSDELSAEAILGAFEYPPDSKMGDIALPCFKFSKILRQAPQKISDTLKQEMDKIPCEMLKETVSLGGYLNFFISEKYLAQYIIPEILTKKENFGKSDIGSGKTAVFDYSSPNVAKPFHIGHLGTTVIGHALKKIHAFAGYNCIGINYLGDWGTQFGKLITAYRLWGDDKDIEERQIDALVELYVKFHAEAEKNPELEETARHEFSKLENGDEENIKLWKYFIAISLKEYSRTYGQLGIDFDSYNGESFYSDKMAPVIEELREKNLLKTDGGATLVDLEAYNMPPCLILKSDGATLYATRDITAALWRKNEYNFDKCVYVTSAGQSLHFAQWFKVIELMGHDFAKQLVHVPYGTVSINGAKLATRTGNVILLKDLFALATEKVLAIINEKNPDLENKEKVAQDVGVGAIVFYYLANNRIKDINFVLDDALSFDGNTGPYAQYTHARCCSILAKASFKAENLTIPENITVYENELQKTLAQFEEKVLSALNDYEPSVITRYILSVCTAFNQFYQNCHIMNADDENVKNYRLHLTQCTKTVLASAFDLICMNAPERI